MNTSSTITTKLFQELPHPLATSWELVLRAQSSADQIRQVQALLDVYFRYVSGILLAGYLREEPQEKIELILPRFSKPSLGHYCELIREILRYFREIESESGEEHFFTHAITWYWEEKSRRDKLTEHAELLDHVVSVRNKIAGHGWIKTESELQDAQEETLNSIQRLLYNSKWLMGYGLFRVSNAKRRRGGGEEGSIHFYKGKDIPLPKTSVWSCLLYSEVMYLSHPNGNQILEVDPFIFIDSSGREESIFLWVSTPKGRRIDLRCERTGDELKKIPILKDEKVEWGEWLDRRTELEPVLLNEHTGDFKSKAFEEVGTIIHGRYRILSKLGEGGMATVYEVYDDVMDEDLALKILHLDQVDTKFNDRTKREFKLMQSLHHPNILPVRSLNFLSDGRIAIGMPLMEGTLKEYKNDKGISTEKVESWAKALFSALEYLHNLPEPIYHRDIKPSNILFDAKGQVYLADFGIARQEGDVRLTRTAEQMGSLPYMAPELIRGEQADAASDRYSLAVSLHELCTGKIPKKVGKGIKGILGDILPILGHADPDERMKVSFADFEDPKEGTPDSDVQQQSSTEDASQESQSKLTKSEEEPSSLTPEETVPKPVQRQSETHSKGDDIGSRWNQIGMWILLPMISYRVFELFELYVLKSQTFASRLLTLFGLGTSPGYPTLNLVPRYGFLLNERFVPLLSDNTLMIQYLLLIVFTAGGLAWVAYKRKVNVLMWMIVGLGLLDLLFTLNLRSVEVANLGFPEGVLSYDIVSLRGWVHPGRTDTASLYMILSLVVVAIRTGVLVWLIKRFMSPKSIE